MMMMNEEPHLFNQAIMEFGALQCIPGIPLCHKCPFLKECFAFNNDKVGSLPVRKKKPLKETRYFHYFVIIKTHGFIMKKRDQSDIWEGLYDFPLIQTSGPESISKLHRNPAWTDLFSGQYPLITHTTKVYRHALTHQVIHARFYLIHDPQNQIPLKHGFLEIPFEKADSVPVPRIIENFLNLTQIFDS
jgi:A/G-specific adenine glycosylase